MRPVLRPGIHVLRRDEGSLQVGLDAEHAVVLQDDAATRSCLSLLRAAAPPSAYDAPADSVREALAGCGLLVDGDLALPLLPPVDPAPPARTAVPTRADVAAVVAAAADDAGKLLQARRGCRTAVTGFGADLALAGQLRALMAAAGIPLVRHPEPTGRRARRPQARVLVGVGEPPREIVDPWLGAGTPYLVVRFTEGTATVGPFVVPTETACLRCIDAHHTDADPSWPLVVTQYSAAVLRDRADGMPEPLDPLLVCLALAWAARDVVTFAQGGRPSTWSATTRFRPALATVETQSWLRHPACGCTWS